MWYTVKIRFYVNEKPVMTFYEKAFWFKRNALDYIDSIESVGIKSDSSLEELTTKGLRVKAELYDRKDNCIYDTRLIVELVEDSRVEVMRA